MLEVQLCRRSQLGAVIPVARSDDPALVRVVAQELAGHFDRLHYADPLLDEVVRQERRRFRAYLKAEGISLSRDKRKTAGVPDAD
jgi:hypothetical protein